MESERIHDTNGWYEIKGNPLSKAGIFEYLGATINAPYPEKIYRVYRPESELSNTECIDSFKLLPWITEHTMLGEGETPAEKKGVEGVIGEDVFYKDGYLKGNIKVFSDHLGRLIDTGLNELSLGYKCEYVFTPGTINGDDYDAIQTHIRGNHLASVEEGRMGSDVAVMDSSVVTFDSRDFYAMKKKPVVKAKAKQVKKPQPATSVKATGDGAEIMDQESEMTLSDMQMMMGKLMPLLEEVEALKAALKGPDENSEMMGDKEHSEEMEEDDMEEDDMEEMDMKEMDMENMDMEEMDMEEMDMENMEENAMMKKKKNNNSAGMDAKTRIIMARMKALKSEVKTLKKQQQGMDSKSFMESIYNRDQLANRLSYYVGTFDHATKTEQEVAKYGIEKLSIPFRKGMEVAALEAYLHNRQPEQMIIHGRAWAMDSNSTVNPVDALFAQES